MQVRDQLKWLFTIEDAPVSDIATITVEAPPEDFLYLLAAVRLAEGSYECDGKPDPRKDTWYFELQEKFAAARSRLEGE